MTNADPKKDNAREVRLSTLEDKTNQVIVGFQEVEKNPFVYGELAKQSAKTNYEEVMNGDKISKERQELYNEKRQNLESSGVVGDPSAPNNTEVAAAKRQHVEEIKKRSPLEELYGVVSKIAPGLKLELPEKLSKYVFGEIVGKVQMYDGKIDKLSPEERDAFAMYQILDHAYNRGCALNVGESGSFSDIEAEGKKITEKYKPKEKVKIA